MGKFRNKLVYITGGSSGIGLILACRMAALGADVLLLARSENRLEKAVEKVTGHACFSDQKVMHLTVDVGNPVAVQNKMSVAVEQFGTPDILVLSAGINTAADHFENITHEMFSTVMNVNVCGVREMIHTLLPHMKGKKSHVVILSSAAALFGMFGYTAYATSKAALMGFAESLRYELKPLGMPVTILFPPEVDTPMNIGEAETLPPQARAVKNLSGLLTPEFVAQKIIKAIEKKRYFVIPDARTRMLYLLHRLSNGALSRWISDFVIKRAPKN